MFPGITVSVTELDTDAMYIYSYPAGTTSRLQFVNINVAEKPAWLYEIYYFNL